MRTIALLLLSLTLASPAFAAKQYSYFRVGNSTTSLPPQPQGTVLMGGGTDVDAAFQWMCQRSGNGDFLVIRATGTDAYNPYIQQLCPNENSVATLIIPNRTAANDPSCIDTIQQCGGDLDCRRRSVELHQFWQGTPVQNTLNALIAAACRSVAPVPE